MMTFKKNITDLLTAKSDADDFSGVVLIQRGEEKLIHVAHGYANLAWEILNQPDTRFRIASVSKMFTAVAVLQLIEAGKLTLETRLVSLLGLEKTKIPPEATVQHMLTMTSGMADWFDESGNWEEDWAALCREHPLYLFRQNEDYLPLFTDVDPVASPGEKHQYNGAGFILLGLAIQKLTGLSYFDAIRSNIFEKAGMGDADFIALEEIAERVAEGYVPASNADEGPARWQRNIYSTTPAAAADGGATCSADDLVRFSQALRAGELLSTAMTAEMLKPHVIQNEDRFRGYDWKYGYGNNFILDDDEQIVRWGHTGEEDGVSCRLYYYPRGDLDVIILGNQSWCAGKLGWEIHDLILEKFK